MSLDVQLIRDSFELVLSRNPDFTARFYEIFFERYPSVKPMFGRRSGPQQSEMLARALTAVIDHLEDSPWLAETLGALGAKHVDYGVKPEMYDWVGESLLATLAEVAGDEWTPAMQENWAMAYSAIVSMMRAGEPLAASAAE